MKRPLSSLHPSPDHLCEGVSTSRFFVLRSALSGESIATCGYTLKHPPKHWERIKSIARSHCGGHVHLYSGNCRLTSSHILSAPAVSGIEVVACPTSALLLLRSAIQQELLRYYGRVDTHRLLGQVYDSLEADTIAAHSHAVSALSAARRQARSSHLPGVSSLHKSCVLLCSFGILAELSSLDEELLCAALELLPHLSDDDRLECHRVAACLHTRGTKMSPLEFRQFLRAIDVLLDFDIEDISVLVEFVAQLSGRA